MSREGNYNSYTDEIIKKYLSKAKTIALMMLIASFVWFAISNAIQAFKCPQLTQTEQMLRMHKTFIADYVKCESR